MIRLFTGLAIPEDVAAGLAALRGGLPGARWIEPSDYHLTLQFIGVVEEHLAVEIDQQLARTHKPPVEVILDNLTVFGGSKPHAVVVAARATPSLLDLQASQGRILNRLGLDLERRKFSPHVTIARLRSTQPGTLAEFIDGRSYFRPRTFVANEFVLFSSARSTGGGPYMREALYPLNA